MNVDPNTFNLIVRLTPDEIVDLIETVGYAVTQNVHLKASWSNKIIAAGVMMAWATEVLEQCGCKIDSTVTNPHWSEALIHKTDDKP